MIMAEAPEIQQEYHPLNDWLPPAFKTFTNLFKCLEDKNLTGEEVVKFDHLSDTNGLVQHFYEYTLTFIKAKCFDELREKTQQFTIGELDTIYRALRRSGNMACNDFSLTDKVSALINIKYELGENA
jgi:hypothetical protein